MDVQRRIDDAEWRTPGKDCGDAGAGVEHRRRCFAQLVRAGLDVARLNFSHGSHEQKAELIAMVRKVAKEEGKPICILADLQGPKIRTGMLVDHKPVLLEAGKRLTITPEQIEGTAERVSTVFTTLAENLEAGRPDSAVGRLDRAAGGGDCTARTW